MCYLLTVGGGILTEKIQENSFKFVMLINFQFEIFQLKFESRICRNLFVLKLFVRFKDVSCFFVFFHELQIYQYCSSLWSQFSILRIFLNIKSGRLKGNFALYNILFFIKLILGLVSMTFADSGKLSVSNRCS